MTRDEYTPPPVTAEVARTKGTVNYGQVYELRLTRGHHTNVYGELTADDLITIESALKEHFTEEREKETGGPE